ncbi:DUF3341 domain-containing protein [Stieleria sp. ICT_E10.1]|uniref:DUF3341 domain-containing protein n=1 Tax=Stieleria sedimenti TaxID=2976331 RepID=UPI00217F7F31|nr:DUF3341 domain-containing protein [Stieleria sedimenti]MCS7465880.1 DUF3341 domain-containing protein [Stieleria sedimenti]
MTDKQPYALIAEFDSVSAVMHAAEQVRDEGYMIWDVHSPMPIHGINQAMGLRPTILPWITLAHGVVGAVFGLGLTWWMNATTVPGLSPSVQGYEFLISGKPTFSLPANIPIIFETTILFAAIGTLLGMLGLNKLPMLHNPLAKSERFLRATADRLFIVISAKDEHFDSETTHQFLQRLSPLSIEVVMED